MEKWLEGLEATCMQIALRLINEQSPLPPSTIPHIYASDSPCVVESRWSSLVYRQRVLTDWQTIGYNWLLLVRVGELWGCVLLVISLVVD